MRILTSSKRMIAFAAVLAGVAVAAPNRAQADLELSWSASTALIGQSNTGLITGINAASGVYSVSGSAVGTASGAFGPGVSGLDLSTISVTSSGPGTLTLYLTENGQTSPTGNGILSASLVAQFLAGTGTVGLVAYGNDTNLIYGNAVGQSGTSPLISPPIDVATPTAVPGGVPTATLFNAVSPYSMTEILTINFTTAGTVSLSSDAKALFSAPEPGTIAMALTALPLLGLGVYARRRRAVA